MFPAAKEVKPENAAMTERGFSTKVNDHFFFGTGGLWEMANRWMRSGCKESPEEFAQYLIAYLVESYGSEPDCQCYDKYKEVLFDSCFVKPGNEF